MDSVHLFTELFTAEALVLKMFLGSIFGLCLGLTGVGGGVLLIPMLQLFCDMSTVLAVGTASMISALVKVNASFCHIKAKNVSWPQVKWLFIGAVPITLLVTQVVIYFNAHPIYTTATQSLIAILITMVMLGSLVTVCLKFASTQVASQPSLAGGYTSKKALLSGMFCGSVLGSTGVGGGVLLLPILNSVLNVDIKKSVGSSVVLALFLSLIAAIGYAKGGQADIYTAIWFVVGSFAGVALSTRLMTLFSERMIYMITIAVITVSLLLYLFA